MQAKCQCGLSIKESCSPDEVIQLALEVLHDRVHGAMSSRIGVIKDPTALKNLLTIELAGLGHEVFGIVFLDTQNRVIALETMFRGSLNHTAVYTREVVKAALQYNAAAVIFYHNHPGGTPQASSADISMTKRLGDALKVVDIQVLEHIVIAGTNTFSFVEQNIMPTFQTI